VSGYVDLHCHYLPGIDDGVRTVEDGVALLLALRAVGYETVVATPHIRTAMFENTKAGLETTYRDFVAETAGIDGLPVTGLAAEHYFDDVFWDLFSAERALPYPGGHAALVEFPSRAIPRGVDHRMFEMNVRGVRPVLAHPERYDPLFKRTDPLDPLLEIGVLPLLDVMSLSGKYGRHPKKAAERMLREGAYYAACSDCHRPADVEVVAESIDRLKRLVGDEEAQELLADNPRHILEGTVEL
jgi:protein-tyrosine phosphatase